MTMLGSLWKIKQTVTWIYYIDVKVFLLVMIRVFTYIFSKFYEIRQALTQLKTKSF